MALPTSEPPRKVKVKPDINCPKVVGPGLNGASYGEYGPFKGGQIVEEGRDAPTPVIDFLVAGGYVVPWSEETSEVPRGARCL